MSCSSTDSGASPPPLEDERELVKPVSKLLKRAKPGHPTRRESNPIIIAAYRYGDPYHKRRVKVPAHITWREFLGLLYSRLEVEGNCDIGIYDENGIEIVSVDDLVPNDVLVVRERRKASLTDYSQFGYHPQRSHGKRADDKDQGSALQRSEEVPTLQQTSSYTVGTVPRRPHDALGGDPSGPIRLQEQLLPPVGTPLLTHFIRANSFGYYFLAEVDSVRVGGGAGGRGKTKRAHCVVKVPPCDKSADSAQIFEMEATLLRKVSGHRSVIASPTVQILNFASEFLQLFFSHLPEYKQPPLAELFFSGTCSEAYIYPLYGVTMATKIKSGLSPEKTVRYAYQLADTMLFLQQRGVIHQTLLPENIQVMSNDRVMVCNFETAVQTDPATCTLLISRSLVAPSNRMGLAPEILNAFNRGNVETIDFSTQYPWSFGALSVVMATGQHPLRNYPGRYLTEGRLKYRSHNYQALPDSSKYPSLFCRLVKRSLSCDPLRRPSLFQITSIMKKDSRTLTMMSSLNRKSNAVPSQGARSSHPRESTHDHREHGEHREHGDHGDLERSGDGGTTDAYTLSRHKPHSATTARAANFSHSAHPTSPDHDHTSPSKRTKTEIQPMPFLDEYQHFQTHSRSHDPQQRSRDSHVSSYEPQRSRESYSRSHDPHDSPNAAHRLRPQPHPEQRQQTRQFTQSYEGGRSPARSAALGTGQPNRGGRESWSDVGRMSPRDSPHIPRPPTRPPSRTDLEAANPRPSVSDSTFSQQRRVSLGGFSDDFAPPGRHFTTGPSGGRGVEEVTQSQSSVRYLEVQQALHEQRMSRKRSSATSESDGNGTLTLDTEYQQLLPEDSPDELQTTQTAGTETERGGTHNRQQQERSPRSSFQSHTPPYMQVATARGDRAISNQSDHQEDPPRSSSAQDLRFGLRRAQQKVRSYEAMRRPLRRPSEDEFRRTLSQQPVVEYDGGSLSSSPASRRCHSDSETRVGRPRERAVSQGGSLHSSPIPAMQPYSNPLRFSPLTIPSWNSFTRSTVQNASMSTSTPPHTADPLTGSRNVVPSDGGLQMEYRDGGFHQSRGEAENPRGREGAEPMQISPNNTQLAFEISDQFSDISTSAQVGGAASVNQSSNVSHQQQFVQSPAVQMTPSALVEANSGVGQTVQHWGQQQLVGAGEARLQAGELQMDYEAHHRGSGSGSQHVSLPFQSTNQQTNAYASAGAVQGHSNQLQHFTLGSRPSLPPSVQRLESQGISIHHRSSDSREDASAELSGGKQLWIGDSREQQTAQPTENESETPQPALPMNPAVTTVYSGPHIMSPIAEASQEYSTQQTTTHTYSATQTQNTQFTQSMHSLSPLPEHTREQQPRRSSSPFQHHALGEAVTTPLSPGVVSDTTNVSITSRVAQVEDRSQTPQLEPPSTSSDTSHSLTRSSEVDSSITNAQADAYVPPQRNEGGDLRSLGQQNRTSAVQGNTAVAQYPPQSLPHAIVDVSDRSSQITPTVEMSSIDFAAIHSQSRLEFPEQEDSILSSRGDPQAPFTRSGTFQSSGTYQSTISEGSRERQGRGGSTPRSTTSAPVGYSSQQSRHHRRVRRSSSPGSGTPSALSDSVAVQFQAARRTPIPSRQQERSHPHDQTASLSQRSQGRGRHRGSTGGSSGSGTGSHTAHRISQDLEMMTRAIEGMDSGQQQLEGSLERDRRASLIREELLQASSSHSPSPSRSSSVGSHGTRPTGSISRGVANRYHASTDTRQQFRPITPAIATNSRRSSSVEPSSNHRISHRNTGRSYTASVTPDLNQARGSTDDARNYNFHHTSNLQNSLVGLSQIAPNEDSPDPIRHATLELGTPNLAQSGTPSTQIDADILSPVQFPSAVVPEDRVVSQRESIVPPPQAGMDPYDYLPPYSPPRPVEEPANQALQRNTVQAGQQQVYPDPPPSYEEIFGQQSQGRQRQRQRRPSRQPRSRPEEDAARVESQSQAERSSHRSGGSRTSAHRRLSSLTSLFKRSRRHSHDAHTTHSLHHSSRTPSHEQQNQASSTSPAPDNQVSLAQSGTVENRRQADGPAPSTLQRTASWVASYSQTPRPITAYQQLERGLREGRGGEDISSSVSAAGPTSHPSTDSQVSRSLSDTAAMGMRVDTSSSHSQPTHIRHHTQPPGAGLPSYRHPPPFLRTPQGTSAHSPTLTNSPTMPYSRPLVHSRGSSLNFSQPNIPTLLPGQNEPNGADTSNSAHQGPVFRRVLAHHPRTRPASTHMMSSELGRIGSSMSSILPTHDFSVQQNVITSAIERLRSDERSLEASASGISSNGPEDQQQRSQETREHLPPRRPYPSQQHDRLENGEGRNLGANGNANNDNCSPTSPNEPSPNATPSPVFRRRSQDQSQEKELNVANSLQPQTLTSENGASQNGNGIAARAGSGSRRNSGERGSCSQRSTPRSRAASRRLAQQLSSSDEDTAVASSSSSSRGNSHQNRRMQGGGNSHSSSQQGSQSQNSPFASPLESRTPVFFPSFQSQNVQTLPDDGIFSAVSNDLTAQSVTPQELVKSHDSHVTSHPASQNQQEIVMSQGSCNRSQPIPPSVQDVSHDSRTPPADMSHDHTITSPNGLHDEVALSPDMSHDRPTPTVTESHDQGEESHDDGVHELSEQLSNSAGELDSATPATSASHSVTDSHTLSLHVSKPCGHVCVAEQLEVCCECMKTRSTLDDITSLLQSCEICESRRLSGQECCCVANKLNNTCPIHGSMGQSSFLSPLDSAHTHPNRKHIKNCIVM